MIRRDEVLRQFLIVRSARQANRPERFAADAEDALHERDVRLDDAPFARNHLDDPSRQIGLHLDGQRRAAQDHLTGHLRDRFDRAVDRRTCTPC